MCVLPIYDQAPRGYLSLRRRKVKLDLSSVNGNACNQMRNLSGVGSSHPNRSSRMPDPDTSYVLQALQVGKPKSSTRRERPLARLRQPFRSRVRLRGSLLCGPHDFPHLVMGSPQKQAVEVSVAEISEGVCNEALGFLTARCPTE